IENLSFDLYDYWESGQDLRKIEGIGQAISEKIDEKFKTGSLGFWDKVAAEIPPALVEVLAIPDVGPKMAKAMWEQLGITSIAEVKAAAQEGKLQNLPRMGAKSAARVLASFEAVERRETGRVHLGVAWPLGMRVVGALKVLPEVIQIELAGSLRRMRETIGDLDFVASTEQPEPIMAVFKSLPEVEEVILAGDTKTSVRFRNGMQADLRCVAPSQWG